MNKGSLNIILHAHLPYVHHPEQENLLEETWFFEAMTECYLPLVRMFDRLLADNIPYRLTVSLSPTLIAMMSDELLRERYLARMNRLQQLCQEEMDRTRRQTAYYVLACMYQRMFHEVMETYQNSYHCDILAAFKKHRDAGRLELITTAATHGYLPLLSRHDSAVRSQVETGIHLFETEMGGETRGFWLPECGYYPGLESILAGAGIDYFFTDSHAIQEAATSKGSSLNLYQPVDCNGTAVFGRDPESSHQVWSATAGYPGDPDYREYYRDIGFERSLDQIGPYLIDGKTRSNTGLKYYKITGNTEHKAPYHRGLASQKAKAHAADFITRKQQQIDRLAPDFPDQPPVITAPFDAELFGHWWFEGPLWLEAVIRQCSEESNGIRLVSASDYLAAQPPLQQATPSASSWGEAGYNRYWLNPENDWIYPHLHHACSLMEQLVADYPTVPTHSTQDRALRQAARCLLLAQASDWAFIMRSGTTVEYANKRLRDHLARFNFLEQSIRTDKIDEQRLRALEIIDHIFPNMDYHTYRPQH